MPLQICQQKKASYDSNRPKATAKRVRGVNVRKVVSDDSRHIGASHSSWGISMVSRANEIAAINVDTCGRGD